MNCSRRKLLKILAGLTVTHSTSIFAQNMLDTDQYNDYEATNIWMNKWMERLGSVKGALHMGRFADRMYYLTKQIQWKPNEGQSGKVIDVPQGFVTDLASIPRIFWSLLPPDGLYTYPAILHDYLYWNQSTTREEADSIFKYAMEDFNVDSYKIKLIFKAVRIGGSAPWKTNITLRKEGEKRVLKKYPSDPTIKWKEWKNIPGVFV